MGLQKRGAGAPVLGGSQQTTAPPPPACPAAGRTAAPRGSGGPANHMGGPGRTARPARHVTCPHGEDAGKADHISNYRGQRWQDLLASLTSASCQGPQGPRGRAVV